MNTRDQPSPDFLALLDRRLAALERAHNDTVQLVAILHREYPRLLSVHAALGEFVAEHVSGPSGCTVVSLAEDFSQRTAAHLEHLLTALEQKYPGLAARVDDRTDDEVGKATS